MTPNDKLIPLRIRLPYGSEEEFIDKYGSNVARGGVFIATRALKPEGSPLAFEFVLADGTRLIRGEGVVVKSQMDDGGRAGMTVRFVRLDAPSKAFIDRLIALRGGQPQPPPPEAPAPAPAPVQATPVPPSLQPRQRAPAQAAPAPTPPAPTPATPPLQRRQPAPPPAAAPPTPSRGSPARPQPPPHTAPPAVAIAPAAPRPPAPEAQAAATKPAASVAPTPAVPVPPAPVSASPSALPPTRAPLQPPPPSEPAPHVQAPTAPEARAPETARAQAVQPPLAEPPPGPAQASTSAQLQPEPLAPEPALATPAEPAPPLPIAAAVTTLSEPAPITPAPAAPPATAASSQAAPEPPRAPEPAAPPALSQATPEPPRAPEPAAPPALSQAASESPRAPEPAAPPAPPALSQAASEPLRAPEPAAPPPPEPELDITEGKPVPVEPLPEASPALVALSSDEAKARRRSFLTVASQPSVTPGPEPAELVLGIDLGTTNSRVAVFKGGAATLLPVDREGRSFALPSIIALDPEGRLVVGEEARAQMLRDPSRAVFGAKRLLGRRARSAKVQELAGRFPYRIEPDATGDAGVRLGDTVHRLPELYARLLTELKDAARAHLGREVTKAVLCVPAYFNDHQRAATREAGKLAGLDVVRLFNEPSAVALAFGYGRGLARKRILVYDLGGGTFDATVVELTGDDLEVVATGGDNFLGGMDFDVKVAAELARTFENREQLRLDPSAVTAQRLRDLAEQVKISLSEQQVTPVFLAAAAERNGAKLDLRGEFTREALERVTGDLVERTVQLTQSVLGSGNLTFQGLDAVLLVGGQSRAPLVRRRVQELAGASVRTDVDATAAVALGAAILGHSLLEASRGKRGVTLSEVLSAPIGIGVKGGGMLRVLDRNTRLPAEKTIELPLRGGERVSIAVFQGAEPRAEENEYLGCLSTGAEKTGELSLRFSVGPDGTLELSALTPGGKHAEVTLATQDASDDVRAALLAQAPLPGEPEPPPESKGLLGGIRKLFGRR